MAKVATPILYEPSLDELNRVRPLKLAERSRLSFDLPVLSKNPVGTGRPIIGKFARCNEQGALLKNTGNSFRNYELKELTLTKTIPTGSITFSQKVFNVLLIITYMSADAHLLLTDDIYDAIIKIMTHTGNYHIFFTGWSLYFVGTKPTTFTITVKVYGFY